MSTTTTEHPLVPRIRAALHTVNDPEIRRPITELGMVDRLDVALSDFAGAGVPVLVGDPAGRIHTRSTTHAPH